MLFTEPPTLANVYAFLDLLPSKQVPWVPLIAVVIASPLAYLFVARYFFQDDFELPQYFTVPIPDQTIPGWQGDTLQEPHIKAPDSTAIRCYAPATGQLLGHVNPVTEDGVDRAIQKASAAQKEWAKTSFRQRRQVLKTMLRYIIDNQEPIARLASLDSGKTMLDASFGEILVTLEKLRWTIAHGEKSLRPERRSTNLLMLHKYNEVRWEPLGVLAACVSWNYPCHNLLSPIISALFTGSAIVIHPSERTSFSAPYFISIVRASLAACDHSPQLVQLVPSWPNVASYLVSHPQISHVTFIGSRPVAQQIARSASKNLPSLCLELGGKDPGIVLDDVRNLKQVASVLMRGVFQAAGQNCIGIERIIALPKSYAKLIEILEPRVKALRVGATLQEDHDVAPEDCITIDIGAMISAEQFDRLEKLIEDAVSNGARLLAGGKRYNHPQFPTGHYFSPTLLVDVTPRMRIAQEEVFAPIALLLKASTVAEAITMANSTSYALGASVFGSSKKDLRTVIEDVRCGMVSVNDFAATYMVQLPFGGREGSGSGYGRFGGKEGLRSICNTKSVSRERWWGLGGLLGTSIPGRLDYDAAETDRRDGKMKFELMKELTWFVYTEKASERLRGLSGMYSNW
ncbi:Meiotic Sister-Chromatid recombination aldehyde dehydrogenase [Agyrium rufum]|nr:Meiotic Sister-Chromatid recombination aldehyde dehydrogenase [Agyrium rufum]